ncbi:DUF805 domain-containing protein [Nitratireductor sp. L1-7-SE]|uniref:DUF805 domain-containing protein n=1 Tax=Nitratireductor rhodophyticola TaxID=2854036 RepID=A0ABS7R791_9HYPH|nr:DUF805 domain-containing protein [Nitratireductor rhodophyticola]MBY8916804.1 DUF805 domain-containing protein [Nitratireductor rhodophyticola]MBY8920767.1 DUF805 domain-containing protein [Nitratireductor rhodophyticola]
MPKGQMAWLFFGFSGRVSRAAFFLAGMLLIVLQIFVLYRFTLAPEGSGASGLWALLFWGLAVVSVFSSVALGVKRLHDFGKPGIFAVSLFIPMVSILAFIVLCLYPGDAGANEYGDRTNAPKQ